GYFYEVVAGQHIIAAKKEIYEETAMEKDRCMCAVYMGVTEEEKMDLALHNATLEAIPFNVLDVLQKYQDAEENSSDILQSFRTVLK
ncbi:unnamed protein product, partial [Darwinula stevensoni]